MTGKWGSVGERRNQVGHRVRSLGHQRYRSARGPAGRGKVDAIIPPGDPRVQMPPRRA